MFVCLSHSSCFSYYKIPPKTTKIKDYFLCGYERWTDEKILDVRDIELAKRAISEIDDEEIEEILELYHENNISLIARLKNEPLNQG